ncbi:MAG: hypothetical protein ACW99R_15195 [Candidatus Hodarchaeales archaeon]
MTIQDYHLEAVIDEENHEGETIPIEGESINAQVAIDADREAFETKFLEIVNPRTTTTTTAPSWTVFLLLLSLFVMLSWRRREKYS